MHASGVACMHGMKEVLRYLMGWPGPSGYGSASTADQVTQHLSLPPNLTAVITGGTSGIGLETARVLAKRGMTVVVGARDVKRGKEVRERIVGESPAAQIHVLELDLSSLTSIRCFASRFLALNLPLNILINNAGKFSRKLQLTQDKYEMTFATNYLGHFVLTEALLPKMEETVKETGMQGRVINVSSMIHKWVNPQGFHLHHMLKPKEYNATRAYSQSKLANILHTREIAKQLKEKKVKITINAVHPGIVKTGIIRDHKGFLTDCIFFIASRLLKSASQGAATTCYVALSPKLEGISGKYFEDCNESAGLENYEGMARTLWEETHALVQRKLRSRVKHTSIKFARDRCNIQI
ncbi:NAD(P)-binding Rossmann-fold superfamily protein [Carex rostrata]